MKTFVGVALLAVLFLTACGEETPPAAPLAENPSITRTREAVLDITDKLEIYLANLSFNFSNSCVMLVKLSDGRRIVEFSNARCPTGNAVATTVQFSLEVGSNGKVLLDKRAGTKVPAGAIGEFTLATHEITHLCNEIYAGTCKLVIRDGKFVDVTP